MTEVTIRGQYNATPPSVLDGREATLQLDSKGQLRVAGFDPLDEMMKVKSVQKKFRDSFSSGSLNTTLWDSVTGTGGSISQSAGVLNLVSGTTINSETYVQTKETFTVPFRLNIGMTLSQRIANQTFIVEAISVDPVTLAPNNLHNVAWVFDGTTATQGKYRTQNGGLANLDSALSTVNTTASGSTFEIELFADECWWHTSALDGTAGRVNSYRRHQQIPDPNAIFKVRLRWLNGGSAPASTTTAAIQYLSVLDYAELTAEITAGRGNSVAGQAMAVSVTSMPTTTVTLSASQVITPRGQATGGPLAYNVNSAATTNAANIKATAGTIYHIAAHNASAATKYVRIYSKATAPTVGTDIPFMVIAIPATSSKEMSFDYGITVATGIGVAITNAAAATDATAVAAGDVQLHISYV